MGTSKTHSAECAKIQKRRKTQKTKIKFKKKTHPDPNPDPDRHVADLSLRHFPSASLRGGSSFLALDILNEKFLTKASPTRVNVRQLGQHRLRENSRLATQLQSKTAMRSAPAIPEARESDREAAKYLSIRSVGGGDGATEQTRNCHSFYKTYKVFVLVFDIFCI